MKRKFSIILSLVLLISVLAGCSKSSGTSESQAGGAKSVEEVISLRAANVTQIDHPMNKAVEFFIEKVQTKSAGHIEIKNYPARQLGDDRELFEQVQQGALDMALISAAPVGSTTELAAALQLPFMFENWNQWKDVITNKVTTDLLEEFDEFNVKALAVYDCGFRNFISVEKPITSADDLKGLKFRVAETPLHIAIFRALNASPTPLPYGEIYTSLQNKVIDGLEMDLPAVLMEKHYEVAKNITLSKHFTWPAIFMMNLDKWNSLSAEDQKLFEDCAEAVLDENIAYIIKLEDQAMQQIEANGITVTELTDDQRQSLINATAGVVEEYKAKNPKIAAFADYANKVKN